MTAVRERTWTTDGKTQRAYQVDFQDAFGGRKRRQFKTKREAAHFIESLGELKKVQTKRDTTATAVPFTEVAERFLSEVRTGKDGALPLEPKTVREYERIVRQVITPAIGDANVGALKRRDVEAARDRFVASGVVRQSAIKHLFVLKAILGFARDRELIENNPAEGVRIKRDTRREAVERQRLPIHTREEMGQILRAAEELKALTGYGTMKATAWKRYQVMLNVLVFAGLRMSELRGLPRDALDAKAGTLSIYQRADDDGNIGPPKSRHGVRKIQLPAETVAMLAKWLEDNPGPPGALAFPSKKGEPLDHQNISKRMWREVQEQAGVRILNPHSARHFFASSLIAKKVQLLQLQKMLGHHDAAFTIRQYGHLIEDEESVALLRSQVESIHSGLQGDEHEE